MRDDRADLLRWCGWFFLCAAALFVLLALRYLGGVNLPAGVGARAFTIAMFLSQGAVLAVLGALLVLPLVLIVPRRRWVIAVSFASPSGATFTVWTAMYAAYRLTWPEHLAPGPPGGASVRPSCLRQDWLKLGSSSSCSAHCSPGARLAARLVRLAACSQACAASRSDHFRRAHGITPGRAPVTHHYGQPDPALVPPADGEALVPQHGLMARARTPVSRRAGSRPPAPRSGAPPRLRLRRDLRRPLTPGARCSQAEVAPHLAGRRDRSASESFSGGNSTSTEFRALLRAAGHLLAHMLGERRGRFCPADEAGYYVEVSDAPLLARFRSHDLRLVADLRPVLDGHAPGIGTGPDCGLRRMARPSRLGGGLFLPALLRSPHSRPFRPTVRCSSSRAWPVDYMHLECDRPGYVPHVIDRCSTRPAPARHDELRREAARGTVLLFPVITGRNATTSSTTGAHSISRASTRGRFRPRPGEHRPSTIMHQTISTSYRR